MNGIPIFHSSEFEQKMREYDVNIGVQMCIRDRPYTDGIKILEEAVAKGHKFEFPVYWGVDLASEHER